MTVANVSSSTSDRTAARVGRVGAICGLAAGVVESTVGSSIREWIGDKNDPTRLGLVTISLAVIALVATSRLEPGDPPGRRSVLVAGIALPAMIGFTTVGRLWYVPGVLLLVAAVLAARPLRGRSRELVLASERHATRIFVSALALVYVALGLAGLGVRGVLGVVGGLAAMLLVLRPACWSWATTTTLVAASVVPFAVMTWWSVVTPLVALLVVLFAALAVRARG